LPAEDFYHYANGGWLKKHPIPDEYSRYGTFDKLREDNRKLVRSIIEEVAKKAENSPDHLSTLVGSFYKMGMDTKTINKLSYEPIVPELNKIDSLQSKADISELVSDLYKLSLPTLFYLYPSPDKDNSEMIMAYLHQGGMGLPDVDYYRNNDDRSVDIRKKYRNYISRMLTLIGIEESNATSNAQTILKMESRLAHAGMTRLEQRDPHKTFNKRNINELSSSYKNFDWKLFLDSLGIDDSKEVSIGQPDFFLEISKMLEEFELDSWKVYMKWRLINISADLISEEFEIAKFEFYGKFLSDKKSMQPRWKRVTSATENALGEAIGKLFVQKYFPPESKSRMLELVENLRIVLGEKIKKLEWMSAGTKKEALEKLNRIRVKIGYPDKWRSFEALNIDNKSYYDNYRQAAIFNLQYEIAKIGKAADKGEWHMTPQTVNAYYHPLLNEIVFPAGILQAPFFYKDADDAVNYGAIGVVIGHEMTHGFDDQGRKFDKNGNLNDWWTEEDAKRFNEGAKVLEDQYNKIKVNKDLYADGKLSLGENIADLGGVNIAMEALKKAWEKSARQSDIDGFTPEQRFFLAYAHLWANNIREKEIIRLTKEDVHSLGINRVNGPLPNVESFHKAFNIKEGDAMYLPENERASIW
jgi:putative endopeptidase